MKSLPTNSKKEESFSQRTSTKLDRSTSLQSQFQIQQKTLNMQNDCAKMHTALLNYFDASR